MKVEDYRARLAKKKQPKYRNQKCVHADGTRFDSKAEMAKYDELLLLWRAGQISYPLCQPRFVLQERPRVTYVGDFYYYDLNTHTTVCLDVKGFVTQAFSIKQRLFAAKYPHVELRIVKKDKPPPPNKPEEWPVSGIQTVEKLPCQT